ncbi:ATP-dependent DNA helicase [Trichonephila clavipes]|nr:ATP-dependent DNA helicase [Trichonephila clavipes]
MGQVNDDICLNEALRHIEDKIIRIYGKKLSDFGMTTPQRRGELSTDLIKKLSYNTALLDTQVSETEPRLLPEQKDIYNKILQRVELAKIRKDHNVALAMASSGIAATLLSGEWMAHSIFKLPLNLASEEAPTCNIKRHCNSEINACLKASYLWTKVEKLYLTTNMRVQLFSDVESGAYAQKLIEIGKGHLDTDQEVMVLFTHHFCHVVELEDELFDQVFPNMQQHIRDEKWLCERTLLAPKNETAAKINKKILGEIASETSFMEKSFGLSSSLQLPTRWCYIISTSAQFNQLPSYQLDFIANISLCVH